MPCWTKLTLETNKCLRGKLTQYKVQVCESEQRFSFVFSFLARKVKFLTSKTFAKYQHPMVGQVQLQNK